MAISLVGHDESLGNCSEDAADGSLCCTDRLENFPFLRQQQTARGVKAPSQHFLLPVNSGCSSSSLFHLLHHPLSCEAPFPLQWDLASKGHHCLLPHFCLGCECLQANILHTKSCVAGCLCRALKKRIGSSGSFAGRHSTSVGNCEPLDGDFPPPFHSIQVPNTRIGGAGAWTCFGSIFSGRVLPFGRFPLGPLVLGFFALACLIASEAAMPECYAGVHILSRGLRWFNYLWTDSCNISCVETLQHFFISCLCIWLALRALFMFDVSWVEQQAASAGILLLLALTWVLLRLLFPRKQHHLSNAARLCREPAEGFLSLPGLFSFTDRRPPATCSCRRRTRRAKVRGGRHCHPQGLTTLFSWFLPFWTVPCFTTHFPAFGAGLPLVAYSFAFATGADAMAAPFEDVLEPDVLPDIARRPHHVMVENLANVVGPTMQPPEPQTLQLSADQGDIPWLKADDQALELPPTYPFEGSTAAPVSGQWIGCTVYTPYMRPVPVAVRCQSHHTLHHCLSVVLDAAPGVSAYDFNRCVPTNPQCHVGFLTLLRFPSVALGSAAAPLAAVLLDMTAVGGQRYACYLAAALPYEDFFDFVAGQITTEDPLEVFIGSSLQPHDPRQPIVLCNGDVVCLLRTGIGRERLRDAQDIFDRRQEWGPLPHNPCPSQTPGVLLQYGTCHVLLRPRNHRGRTVIDAALSHCDDLTLEEVTSCAFPTPDLALHGEFCSHILLISALPATQRQGRRRARRRDYFILCDFRPLGRRPRILQTHTPLVHLPSIAAMYQLPVPPNNRLTATGGVRQGEDLVITGHCVLRFFLEPSSSDEESDAGPSPGSADNNQDDSEPGPDDDPPRGPPPSGDSQERSQTFPSITRRSRSRSRDRPASDHSGTHQNTTSAAAPLIELAEPALRLHKLSCSPPDILGDALDCLVMALQTPFWTARVEHVPWSAYQHPFLREAGNHTILEPWAWAKTARGAGGPRLTAQTDRVQQAALTGQELEEVELPVPYQRGSPETTGQGPEEQLIPDDNDTANLALCLIYAPGYVPDVVVQTLGMPCSVAHAIDVFGSRRDPSQAASFDQLFPAMPQPARELAVLVAMPSWETAKVCVLFNCLSANRTLFAAMVHPRLNKASLLHVAGFGMRTDLDVFVFGLLQPIDELQWLALRSGMTICVSPTGSGPGPSWNLEDMLQDPVEWNHNAPIPGPPPPAGSHFWILTDGMPVLFKVEPGRRRFVQNDIVDQLCHRPDLAVLRPTKPRIIDHMAYGLPTWAVLVLTEARQTIPFPPARLREYRLILTLDCRAILLGFQWLFVTGPTVSLQVLADRFHDTCPETFLVVFKGAEIVQEETGPAIAVSDGVVIKVEFVEGSDSNSSEPAPSHPSEAVDMQQDNSSAHDDEQATLGEDAPTDSDELSVRSRTPRPENTAAIASPAQTFLWVYQVLAPGFTPEYVEVSLPKAAAVHDITKAVQTARAANFARAFPLLQPVHHQPGRQWGTFLALPIWKYEGIIICVDMFTHWSRVFSLCVPAHTAKADLLVAAGLAPAADVDVFLNCTMLTEGRHILKDGDCLSIVWRGEPAPNQISLHAFAAEQPDGPAATQLEAELPEDHYCLVSQDANRLFTLRAHRAAFYKADIASRIDCDVRELLLVPSAPQPQDACMYGHPCRSVVVALRAGHLPPNLPVCAVLLDARRILQGWLPIMSYDGWICVSEITTNLCQTLPDDWLVQLEGVPEDQEWLFCEQGDVFRAICVPRPEAALWVDNAQLSVATTAPVFQSPEDSRPAQPSEGRTGVSDASGETLGLPEARQTRTGSSANRGAVNQLRAKHSLALGAIYYRLCLWMITLGSSTTIGVSMYAPVPPNTGEPGSVGSSHRAEQIDMWPCGFDQQAHAFGPHIATPFSLSTSGLYPSDKRHLCTRPIATPCRIRLPNPCSTALADIVSSIPGQTVIDEAYAVWGEQLCFKAWTLLETLNEHLGAIQALQIKTREEQAQGQADSVSLQLQDLVQWQGPRMPQACVLPHLSRLQEHPSPGPVGFGGMQLGFNRSDLIALLGFDARLQPWDAFFNPAHPFTQGLLSALEAAVADTAQHQMLCYTDGSYYPPTERCGPRAGWAFLLIAPADRQIACLNGAIPPWAAASGLSAYVAECWALAMAHLITALHFARFSIRYKSDCQAALGIAAGTTTFQLDVAPQVLANAVTFRRAVTLQPDDIIYVPGHTGDFFNEAADRIAKQGAGCSYSESPRDAQGIMDFWCNHGGRRLGWAATALQSIAGNATMPPLGPDLGNDSWHGGLSHAQLIEPFIPCASVSEQDDGQGSTADTSLTMCIVSYNTLSLGASLEEQDGVGTGNAGLQFRPARAALLAEQLHVKGVSVAALQETRCPEGRTSVGQFLRYSSGAQKGQLGTELWLHKERPILQYPGTPERICFTPSRLTVVHHDPRRILVRFQYKSWRLLLASLRAPHRACEAHAIDTWWSQTRQLIHKFAHAAFVVLAGDVNASVGA